MSKWKTTTEGGMPVRIYAEDAGGDFPIHGAFFANDRWFLVCWNKQGHRCGVVELKWDLVPNTPAIDWSQQPAWCKAVAMDYDGVWHRLDGLPVLSGGLWIGGVSFRQSMHPSEYPVFDGDWKDSLCVRPEGGDV